MNIMERKNTDLISCFIFKATDQTQQEMSFNVTEIVQF